MSRRVTRSGFTLFELLLVMLLLVIIYGLFMQNFVFENDPYEEDVKLERLNLYLLESISKRKAKVSLKCVEDCSECHVLLDGIDTNKTISLFDKEFEPTAYKYDGKRLDRITYDDYYKDEYKREKVCFDYSVYPNGSADKVVLEYQNKVYLLENYMEEGRVFASLDEASDYLDEKQLEAKGR
ncbi:MAG: prepilin-type N-terminal cleavage/methylation domain-containing protein [Campylobacteraceae bacterium]|jgi:prepilin-type N-terminal cleavage/methylation domain-containing protein|nr:prepilin-type N-terminal cleavage/methylation domain-containing protein [Campylobacteraceae bacterium]